MSDIILLIGFYNENALGVKYLSNTLKKSGYQPKIVYFKEFNSVNPKKATDTEINLLLELIKEVKPSYIGMSIMASLYLESVYMVSKAIKQNFNVPIIWGGVYPTLFPQKSLDFADYVIRGEGEEALVELLNFLKAGKDISTISNLVYKNDNGEVVTNDIRPLKHNLDELGYPEIGGQGKYFIHNNTISQGDPQLKDMVYEMSASRGCPFACSYCSSINLKRIYNSKGKYVRFRSIESVMNELIQAKERIKNLKAIHFWDEIFPDDQRWIEEFKSRYKKEINIPFKIWGHPLKTNKATIEALVEAGLYQIVVGIQSGSQRVRKEVFNRTESQQEIIESSKVLSESRVPRVIYDFMLQHPFETIDDLKATYDLCLQLHHPFELQIHGLNFLPGTDIVDKAIDEGLFTKEELEKIMYSPIQQQYDMYWGAEVINKKTDEDAWMSLIYLTQFPRLRPLVELLANEVQKGHGAKVVLTLKKVMSRARMVKSLKEKAKLVIGKR